jgi:site-specific recombinase XerD
MSSSDGAPASRRGKIWWIRYTVPGERKERCESSESSSKADAIKLLNRRRREVDKKTIVPADATIGHLLDLYLADKKRTKGCRDAEAYVRLHLRPAFGKVKSDGLTSVMVENFIAQKKNLGRANASINRWLEGLHRAFTLGYKNRPRLVAEIPEIPMLDESDNVREGLLSHENYVKLREELPPHQLPLLVIGYHLGMRRGEILGLRWDQVDWKANLIRLEKRQTKGKQARNAPLYGELRAWLEMAYASPEHGETIVSWKGVKISETKRAWNAACKRAGVPHLYVHDLRRTAISNMINGAGIPEKTAMLISGHKTRSILDRYSIVVEKDIHTAGRRMEAYLAEQEKVRTKVRTPDEDSGSPQVVN